MIHGDHGVAFDLIDKNNKGYWIENPSDDLVKDRFSILNAIYLPDKYAHNQLNNVKTPVNIFRAILNQVFEENLSILEEKQYFSSYKDLCNFSEITELFNDR